MTAQDMLDVLNNRDEIPDPSKAHLDFYLVDEDSSLKLVHIGAFDISSDVTMGFEKY